MERSDFDKTADLTRLNFFVDPEARFSSKAQGVRHSVRIVGVQQASPKSVEPGPPGGSNVSTSLRFEAIGPHENLLATHDFLVSVHSTTLSFGYLLLSSGRETQLYYFLLEQEGRTKMTQAKDTLLEDWLHALNPGIDLANSEPDWNVIRGQTKYVGIVTGLPEFEQGQIDRVIRSLAGGRNWILLVAEPVEPILVSSISNMLKSFINAHHSYSESSFQEQGGLGEGESRHRVNVGAKLCLELAIQEHARCKAAGSEGLWSVSVFYGAELESEFERLSGLLKAIFTPIGSSKIDPTRTHRLDLKMWNDMLLSGPLYEEYEDIWRYYTRDSNVSDYAVFSLISPTQSLITCLTTTELSIWARLPTEEVQGYSVYPSATFGSDVPSTLMRGEVSLGYLTKHGRSSEERIFLDPNVLVRHALVVGTTGSGKTNTIFKILLDIGALSKGKKSPVRFLVIEPTKGEYRHLKNKIADLRIFTLGEGYANFSFNPFEVPDGVFIQRHIDLLATIFAASFPMWGPLPYILSQGITNVYQKRGWYLFGKGGSPPEGMSYPTLSDLYQEIDVVTESLGYKSETTSEIRAALKTRIRSLLFSEKGRMLNCKKSIPISELVSQNTILELRGIGNDDEKAFLMGMLFGTLFEYMEALGPVSNLRHLTIIEEAHRLLSDVGRTHVVGENVANPRGAAVDTLCNILSEVRAYGEGIIISDQAPVGLAQAAIKNTNLKICHKLVSGDDREVIQKAIGLDRDQDESLIVLKPFHAIFFNEDLHEPFSIEIDSVKPSLMTSPVSDEEITLHMKNTFFTGPRVVYTKNFAEPFVGCDVCEVQCEYRFVLESGAKRLGKELSQLLAKNKEFSNKMRDLDSLIGETYAMRKDLLFQGLWARYCAAVQAINSDEFENALVRADYSEPNGIKSDYANMFLQHLRKRLAGSVVHT
jgi:hypothetical protein